MQKELAGHVRNSVQRHDVGKSGSLNEAESQAFIQHYVDAFVAFHKRNDTAMAKKMLDAQMKMMSGMGMPKEIVGEMKKQAQEAMTKQMDTIKKDFDERRTKYNQNKVELDKKAFAVIDTKKNGKLEEQEVVDALTPDTPKYAEFHAALGLLPS